MTVQIESPYKGQEPTLEQLVLYRFVPGNEHQHFHHGELGFQKENFGRVISCSKGATLLMQNINCIRKKIERQFDN